MLFHSSSFLLLLTATCLLHHFVPRYRIGILLVSSAIFYASWNPVFYLVLVAVVWFNYRIASDIEQGVQRKQKLVLGIVADLGILFYFKYFKLACDTLSASAAMVGINFTPEASSPFLPLGVSFYTFQNIAYLVDVYYGRADRARNFKEYLLYATFFVHLIAGPIIRSRDLIPALHEKPSATGAQLAEGGFIFLRGIFRKVLLADRLALISDPVFAAPSSCSSTAASIAVLAYTFQIYFDFAGYTDMARGAALMLGYRLPENFLNPYLSPSIRDFWRRWHVTLSLWLRDYLYIPLGGGRFGPWKAARNLLITMFLGGLWHGASWTFAVWGLYHGLLLVLHRRVWEPAAGYFRSRTAGKLPRAFGVLYRAAAVVATFVLVSTGWVFFRAHSTADALQLLGRIAAGAAGNGMPDLPDFGALLWLIPLYLMGLGAIELTRRLFKEVEMKGGRLRSAAFGASAGMAAAIIAGWLLLVWTGRPGETAPFIYFQF